MLPAFGGRHRAAHVEALRMATCNERAFGQVLNVGTGQGITLHDIALEMCRVLSQEPRIKVSGRYRSGDIRHAVASVGKLEQQLGFVPPLTAADYESMTRGNALNCASRNPLRMTHLF